jgi:hypothetical protein
MSKMGLHNPFGHLKHKLWPKEGLGVNLSLCAGGVPHTIKKLSMRATTFLQTSFQSEVCTQSYGPPKAWESQLLGVSRLPLGSLGTKEHLGVGPMAMHKIYYKGEGGGFPQVQAVVSLVSLCLFVPCLCTKVLQLRTN